MVSVYFGSEQVHSNVRFGKLTQRQWKKITPTLEEANTALGGKEWTIIAPDTILSTVRPEQNTGIGSYTTSPDLFTLAAHLGAKKIQSLPGGRISSFDPSPYTGDALSRGPWKIDLHALTQPSWGNLLIESDVTSVAVQAQSDKPNFVDYKKVEEAYAPGLKKAAEAFRQLPASHSLNKEFKAFVTKHSWWLKPYALYEALTEQYGTDYWVDWNTGATAELDRTLLLKGGDKEAKKARINELIQTDPYQNYLVIQFIADKQHRQVIETAQQQGVALVGDRQVGFSNRDQWANQSLFLKDWKLGCPPDYFSKNGQPWGNPVLDPKLLFKADGSLGPAGIYMKKLFTKLFKDHPGGLRVDHMVGLIDPWVYKPNAKSDTTDGGRLYSSPLRADLAKYALIGPHDVNPSVGNLEEGKDPLAQEDYVKQSAMKKAVVKQYARFAEHIVLAAAREAGVPKDSIIAEDLGTLTTPVKAVMAHLKLKGIRLAQFFTKGFDEGNTNRTALYGPTIYTGPGTHDNPPSLSLVETMVQKAKTNKHLHSAFYEIALKLSGTTFALTRRLNKMLRDPLAALRAFYADLVHSKSNDHLVFINDLLGIDTVFNNPGDPIAGQPEALNWKQRLPLNASLEDTYLAGVAEGKGFNVPQVLADALKARGSKNTGLIKRLEAASRAMIKEGKNVLAGKPSA